MLKQSKAIDMRFYWLRDRSNKVSSGYIGRMEIQTKLTTSPNIIWLRITKKYGIFMSYLKCSVRGCIIIISKTSYLTPKI